MDYDLAGRLELVRLERELTESCALGRYGAQRVLVNGGNEHVGGVCLARYDLKVAEGSMCPMANFITSTIPSDFTSLGPEEYILVASWDDKRKTGPVPTFKEFHDYYNPGHSMYFFFFQKGKTRRRGRIRVNLSSITPMSGSVSKIIKALPDPLKYSRVMVVEEESQLEYIMGNIRENSQIPILMEPQIVRLL